MSCINPLVRIDLNFLENHSLDLKIFQSLFPNRKFDLMHSHKGAIFFDYDSFFEKADSQDFRKLRDKYLKHKIISIIPCGKCLACNLNFARQWAIRIMSEFDYYENRYFVTLTYDDLHITFKDFVDENKEVFTLPILEKDELRSFIKRLRYYLGDDLKFFACGEYGSTTFRPHYHMILLSHFVIPEIYFDKVNQDNHSFYNSKVLDKIWNKGFHSISECNINTIFYTVHYCLKKANSKDLKLVDFDGHDFPKEFRLMSRRPGLGQHFWKDKLLNNFEINSFKFKNLSFKINDIKYFDYLYDSKMIWRPIRGFDDSKVKYLFMDRYLSKIEKERFVQQVQNMASKLFRNQI